MKRNEVTEIQNLNHRDHFYFLGDAKKTIYEKGSRINKKIQTNSVYTNKIKFVEETRKVVFLCPDETDA